MTQDEIKPAPVWISCLEKLPEIETKVLIICNNEIRLGALEYEIPSFEETFTKFKYWFEPDNDMQVYEFQDITHWMPLPASPTIKE